MTLALQLFKNSINTQEKLRLNLHSLSVSELLEYRREALTSSKVGGGDVISLLRVCRSRSHATKTTILFLQHNYALLSQFYI